MAKDDPIDLRHVTCGLVPAMVGHLDHCEGDSLAFLVRPGIGDELVSGFGSGGAWDFRLEHDIGHDVALFRRRPAQSLRSGLNLLDY